MSGKNVRSNSREAFQKIIRSGKNQTFTAKVIQLLAKEGKPLSRRQISQKTGIEVGTLCRILLDAIRTGDPIIRVVSDERCPVTGHKAMLYVHSDFYKE